MRTRRMRVSRTTKPRGLDVSTLASTWRQRLRVAPGTVTKKPDRRRERGISRNAIAQGMPDRFGGPVVDLLVCFLFLRTRLRASQTPGIPCSLSLGDNRLNSGESRRENAGACPVRDVEQPRPSWPGLLPSRKLRRPSELVARRSLGGDGTRPSTSLLRGRKARRGCPAQGRA